MNPLLDQSEAGTVPQGAGCLVTRVEGRELPVFSYRPATAAAGIVLVFDGLHRKARYLHVR